VDFYLEKRGRTFKSVKQRFKKISERQFRRFYAQAINGGSKNEKWKLVDEFVWEQFQDARKKLKPVHDDDIKKWALTAAGSNDLASSISSRWIASWKSRRGVVSRKVSRIWPTAKLQKAEAVAAAAIDFRKEVLEKLADYDPDMILNTDQSGYQYEFFSGRTLSFKGENATPLAIRSMNKTTHSYTIQPTLR
jgi:hypothetical protein